MSTYISSDLYKYLSRPVAMKAKFGDLEIEYASENDEPVSSVEEEIHGRHFATVATQTDYRESEAQTDPWDPDFVVKKVFNDPEVLYLKELSYGNGLPASQIEVEYILQSRKNRELDVPGDSIVNYESFLKKKQLICSQVQNEWNYNISKQSQKLLNKLKQMETALAQELAAKSVRQEKLLKNLWTQKNEQMTKMSSKFQRELKKELGVLEKRSKGRIQKFDAKAYGLNQTSKELAHHINKNKESLNKDIDCLISKYRMNPVGLSKLTDWLERKRKDLYNEIPTVKPVRRIQREKLTEKAYQDLLKKKRAKMPPRIYREDYDKDECATSSAKIEVEFELLELPEEGVDLVTVWQQVLRGRAYQKQMLELINKHKDTLDVLLSSQIKL